MLRIYSITQLKQSNKFKKDYNTYCKFHTKKNQMFNVAEQTLLLFILKYHNTYYKFGMKN